MIECLPSPGAGYCGCGTPHPARDSRGEPVMIASIMDTWPAHDLCPKEFTRPSGTVYLSDVVDQHYDVDTWRFWPSYIGTPKATVDCASYELGCYEEQPMVRRIWCGIPLSEIGADIASEIMSACNTRVEATPWWWVDRMYGYLESEDPPTEEELAADVSGWHNDFIETREGLKQCGMWDITANEPSSAFTTELDYRPMADYLSSMALQIWNELNARSRAGTTKAARTIRKGERNLYLHRESEFDPWC